MKKPFKLSFIQKMQLELSNYHIEKIKKKQQQFASQEIFKKQNQATLALIQLQQNQRNKFILNNIQQGESWSISKTTLTNKSIEIQKFNNISKESQKQKIDAITLGNTQKRFPFKNIINRNLGLEVLTEQNNAIPQLKLVLEKLNSPQKKKKEHTNFFSQRTTSRQIHNINNNRAKFQIEPCFEKQKEAIIKKQNFSKMKQECISIIKECKTPKKNKKQNEICQTQFLTFSEGRKTHKLQFKNRQFRALTTKSSRLNFINTKKQKQQLLNLNTIDFVNISSSKQKQLNKSRRINASQNQQHLILNQKNSNVYLFANFQYGKIKRDHPSSFEINKAYEKDLLHQLIKGKIKKNFKTSFQGKTQKFYKKRDYNQKLTLTDIFH